MSGKRTLKPVDLDLDEPGKDMSRLFASSLSPDSSAQHDEDMRRGEPLARGELPRRRPSAAAAPSG